MAVSSARVAEMTYPKTEVRDLQCTLMARTFLRIDSLVQSAERVWFKGTKEVQKIELGGVNDMADCMTFPATFDEFAEQYKIIDKQEVYTNGTELIPIFRVKQWLDHSKSEVDALINAVDNSTKEFLKLHDAYQEQKREVEMWKAEAEQCYSDTAIMREYTINQIFDDIEKEIFEKRISFYEDFKLTASLAYDKTKYAYADTMITNLKILKEDFAELKKKYTEGEQRND